MADTCKKCGACKECGAVTPPVSQVIYVYPTYTQPYYTQPYPRYGTSCGISASSATYTTQLGSH